MKKLVVLMLAVLLLLPRVLAENVPSGVAAYVENEQKYYDLNDATIEVEEYVQLNTAERAWGAALMRETSGWSWCVFFVEENGQMIYLNENGGHFPQKRDARETLRLFCEEDTARFVLERRDVRGEARQRIVYTVGNGDIDTAGWFDLDASNQRAVVENGTVVYYDAKNGASVGRAEIAPQLLSCNIDFEVLPKTAAEAQNMMKISRTQAENLYPGWVLRVYQLAGDGRSAEAAYSRIEEGRLTLRRAQLKAEDTTVYSDTIPVPLSKEMLTRLETEAFDTLISAHDYGDTFLTENAIDRAQLVISGRIIQSDLQKDALILLTEEEERRDIWVVEQTERAYHIRRAGPFSEKVYLDLAHSGEGSIQPCMDGLLLDFSRNAREEWVLDWVQDKDVYRVS